MTTVLSSRPFGADYSERQPLGRQYAEREQPLFLRQTQSLNACTQCPQRNPFKLQQRRLIGKRTVSFAERTHSLRCDTTQQLPAQPNHRIPIRCTGQSHSNPLTNGRCIELFVLWQRTFTPHQSEWRNPYRY